MTETPYHSAHNGGFVTFHLIEVMHPAGRKGEFAQALIAVRCACDPPVSDIAAKQDIVTRCTALT